MTRSNGQRYGRAEGGSRRPDEIERHDRDAACPAIVWLFRIDYHSFHPDNVREIALRNYKLAILGAFLVLSTAAGADPKIHLLTANPAAELKVTVDRRHVAYETLIQSDAAEATKGVRVYVTPLAGPARVTPQCTVDDKPCASPFDLDALQSRTLKLTADLDAPGAYTTIISTVAGTERQNVTLTVTRAPSPALPMKVLSLANVEGERGCGLPLRINLQETAGVPHTMNPPALIDLALNRPGSGRVQANGASLKAYWPDDKTELKPGVPWTLPAGGPTTVKLVISGLDTAGAYSGTVRFSSPDAQVVDQPLSVMVRSSAWAAAGIIALGVLLSYLLHSIVSLRPWFVQQQAATTLAEDLQGIVRELKPDEEESRVVAGVSGALDALMRKFDDGKSVPNADATLEELDRKLTLLRKWIVAHRRINALPAAIAAQVRKPVDDAETALATNGLTADAAAKAASDLDQLGAKIDEAIQADLKNRIAAMQMTLQGAATGLSAPEALNRVRNQVLPALKAATDAAAAKDFPAARAAFGKAQAAYAKATAIDLRARLEQQPPAGFDAASWAKLKADLAPSLIASLSNDGEKAIAAARSALATFLTMSSTKLAELAVKLKVMINTAANVPAANKPDLLSRAGAMETSGHTIAAQVAQDQVEAAAAAYATAIGTFTQLKSDVAGFGIALGAVDAAAPAAAAAAGDLSSLPLNLVTMLVPRASRSHRDPGFWKGLVVSADAIVFVFALVVAVILGLKLLWLDNHAWGSFSDYLIALLWGLGLHQISGNAFEGIPALIAKFK